MPKGGAVPGGAPGPRSSLDTFLKDVRRRALRMAALEIRDPVAAADLVQDAMLRLTQRYAERPSEEWVPLFYRILRNRITDWRRRRQLERIFEFVSWSRNDDDEPDSDVDYADPTPGPESQALGSELGRRIATALAQLPGRQREAFMLREWEGLSVAESALAMGVSEGSVKTHHFRAISQLRALLHEDKHR